MKTIKKFLAALLGRSLYVARDFKTVLREYIDKQKIENCLTQSTANKYEFYYNNIVLFLTSERKLTIKLSELKPKDMEALKFWLHKNLKTCSVTHSSRHIELCKRVMKYAVLMEEIAVNPLDNVPVKRDKIKDVVCLNKNELEKLMYHDFKNDIYRIVADLYVFQAFTGLSYADLKTFSVVYENERPWIYNNRVKNENPYWVPLFDRAKWIYDKYDGKLPEIANQTYNRALKEISRILNIKKHLTTHTARKTFATNKHNEGWNSKLISLMMGQKSVEVFEGHYLKVDRVAIENEMKRLQIA